MRLRCGARVVYDRRSCNAAPLLHFSSFALSRIAQVVSARWAVLTGQQCCSASANNISEGGRILTNAPLRAHHRHQIRFGCVFLRLDCAPSFSPHHGFLRHRSLPAFSCVFATFRGHICFLWFRAVFVPSWAGQTRKVSDIKAKQNKQATRERRGRKTNTICRCARIALGYHGVPRIRGIATAASENSLMQTHQRNTGASSV